MAKPTPPRDIVHFGERLRWAIAQSEFSSQAALARRLSVKAPQISQWVKRDDAPSEATVERLSDLLGVPSWWLRYGDVGSTNGGSHAPEDSDPLEEWVADFERRVRNVGGKGSGMSEFERSQRIHDAIESQIAALQMLGNPVPARLYELREALKRGEI